MGFARSDPLSRTSGDPARERDTAMKCDNCGEREATVHYTEIEDGEKKETHLCDECYREKLTMGQKVVEFTEVLQKLFQGAKRDRALMGGAICPCCGMSLAEFQASGRLGCPNDYKVFGDQLKPLLEKIQHDVRHVGKVPSRAGPEAREKNELIRLRRELERAVQREEYERAAQVRDEIRRLSGGGDAD